MKCPFCGHTEDRVVDWDKVDSCKPVDPVSLSTSEPELFAQYAEHVVAKHVLGSGGMSDGSFLVHDGKVYAIDDQAIGKPRPLSTLLKKKRAGLVKDYLLSPAGKNRLRPKLRKWAETAAVAECPGFSDRALMLTTSRGVKEAFAPKKKISVEEDEDED